MNRIKRERREVEGGGKLGVVGVWRERRIGGLAGIVRPDER